MIPMRESAVLGWRQTVGCLGNRAGVCSGGCGGGAKAALASYFLCFLSSINPRLPSQAASLIRILYHDSNQVLQPNQILFYYFTLAKLQGHKIYHRWTEWAPSSGDWLAQRLVKPHVRTTSPVDRHGQHTLVDTSLKCFGPLLGHVRAAAILARSSLPVGIKRLMEMTWVFSKSSLSFKPEVGKLFCLPE